MIPQPPLFLGSEAVHETGKAFYTQLPLVSTVRTNGNGVSPDVLQQLLYVCTWCSDELTAEHHSHLIVYLIGIDTFGWLAHNNLFADTTCKIKHGQVGKDFLFRKGV